jgi:CRP-like cAMP-binding protein
MNKAEFLQNVPAFADMSANERDSLALRLQIRTFADGDQIFIQGEAGSTLYIIVSGQVRIYTTSDRGQEVSLRIFGERDFFGELALLDGGPRSATAEAMCATKVLMLDRTDFLRTLYDCPPIAVAILEALAARLRQMTARTEHLTAASAGERIVGWLIDLAHQHGVREKIQGPINVRITQTNLASLAGTSRETVNRVLSNLQRQGVIEIERTRITILNLPLLQHGSQ